MNSTEYSYAKDRPIGVFDSGLGGLTAVKEIIKVMPNENLIYFGDTGRVPYGSKSPETILRYAGQDIRFLESAGVKTIVAACGTVSSVPGNIPRRVPFTGVLGPACISAAASTKNKKIGVIGTCATINSGSYEREIKNIDSRIKVYCAACPLFVPLIESGFVSGDDEIVRMVVQRHLEPLLGTGIDTLIMGCTHYPIIEDVISDFLGKNVTTVDPGKETAGFLKKNLEKSLMLSERKTKGTIEFHVSDGVSEFTKSAGMFLGKDITGQVYKTDVCDYEKKEVNKR